MKLHLLCLIVAISLLTAKVITADTSDDYYGPTTVASFPWTRSRDKTSADNYIANGTPFAHATVIVNGNVALELHSNREKCERPRPELPFGYSIISEDEEYITAIKYHPIAQNWNEARKICLREGGFLAYPTSKEEEDLYLKVINDNRINVLWIGIHDYYQDGDYATVLGEIANEVAYYTWLPGEPNNAGGPEPCIHYWRVNEIIAVNDVNCGNAYQFNCKIKLRKN